MNISEFKNVISAEGLLDPTRYTVNVMGPAGVGPLSENLSVMCSSVTLPGRGFSTTEKYNHGPIRKVPYSELYDVVQTVFYISEDLAIYDYFLKWQRLIGGEDYYIGYYKDIIGSLVINIENKQDEVVGKYELFEAYPTSVSQIDMSYANVGVVPVVNVNWAYHHFEKK